MSARTIPTQNGGLLSRLFGFFRPQPKIQVAVPKLSSIDGDRPDFGTGSRKKILIIDDDAVVVKTTAMKLKAAGYAVAAASDASSAIEAVHNAVPDVILLDMSFPPDVAHGSAAWDGRMIISWLRRFKEAQNIPI